MYVLSQGQQVLKFPYSPGQLIEDNPDTSFPLPLSEQTLASWGVYRVEPQPWPTHNEATEEVITEDPVYTNDQWFETFSIKEYSQEEIAIRTAEKAGHVREERNQKLKDSDWTQLPDSPVDKEAWAVYRQDLRNISQQAGFPWDVTWPEKP